MGIDAAGSPKPHDVLAEMRLLLERRYGWQMERSSPASEIWSAGEDAPRIFLPMSPKSDFWIHINDALEKVAAHSNERVEDLEWHVSHATHDRLTSRIAGPTVLAHQDEIDRRIALGDALDYAARSAASKEQKRLYAGRPKAVVTNYLGRVAAAPSSTGSYVYRFLLPNTEPANLGKEHLDPASNTFRRFNLRAASTISDAAEAASDVITSASLERWDEVVENGVSSNLCEALARHVRGPVVGDESRENGIVDIQFHYWSTHVSEEPRAIRLSSEMADALEGGAAYLRGETAGSLVVVVGEIQQLTESSRIVVRGVDEGDELARELNYRVDVDAGTHDAALAAYREGLQVKATMEVTRSPLGRTVSVVLRDFDLLQPRLAAEDSADTA